MINLFKASSLDAFAVLGVSKASKSAEIKKAYKKLLFQTHPDHGGDVEKFIVVNDAYRLIKKTRRV